MPQFTGQIKDRAKAVLGFLGVLSPAEYLWRSLSRSGRKVNANMQHTVSKVIALYGPFVQPGDLVFDVGAHDGVYTEIFLKLGLRIVAIEPQDACVSNLRAKFGRNKRVHIVVAGLAESEGEREFMITHRSMMSSMSPEFIRQIRNRGGKFSNMSWERTVTVPVTTCDKLIAQYGLPTFIKIDVEGYEYNVIQGLTQPVKGLSFEYTSELMQPALDCVRYLAALGQKTSGYVFNYARSDEDKLVLADWVEAEAIQHILGNLAGTHTSGDVFARLRSR